MVSEKLGKFSAGTRFHSHRNEVSFAFYTKRWMVLHHFAACLAGVASHELMARENHSGLTIVWLISERNHEKSTEFGSICCLDPSSFGNPT